MEIQFNNKNIIPELNEYEFAQLETVFKSYEKKFGANSKFFAFVNVLWYSLSDAEHPQREGELAFPKNFTVETLINLMHLAAHLYTVERTIGTTMFVAPPQSFRKGTLYIGNPAYQALMYFRDDDQVCHNLINYVPGGRTKNLKIPTGQSHWVLHHWDQLIQDADMVYIMIKLGQIDLRTLL